MRVETVYSPALESAICALRAGKMVILLDEKSRENEGDLVMAAEKITPDAVNFMLHKARGVMCVPLLAARAKRLGLTLMATSNPNPFSCAFTVSVDAKSGIGTGSSTQDRAKTISLLANDEITSSALSTPGHVFPILSHPKGLQGRQGHTEGSLHLMQLAGLKPVSVICEVLREDGKMARLPYLESLSKEHGLCLLHMHELHV